MSHQNFFEVWVYALVESSLLLLCASESYISSLLIATGRIQLEGKFRATAMSAIDTIVESMGGCTSVLGSAEGLMLV